jgi:hypothetical protein
MTKQAELAFLFRTLKAPAAARALPKLAERARAEEWSYERFDEALLATEVASRDAHGGEARIKIVDEVGYIPFDAQAANLMFSLVSSRYERASLIVTSNKPFSDWGEISATRSWPPP